jgi:hypothetical protein
MVLSDLDSMPGNSSLKNTDEKNTAARYALSGCRFIKI